jgi:cation transport protein ChaC
VGFEPVDQLAKTVYEREGPSGPNKVSLTTKVLIGLQRLMLKDYVYKLAESVRQLYPDVRDDYLFELEVSPHVYAQPDVHSNPDGGQSS